MAKATAEAKYAKFAVKMDGCWEWLGTVDSKGYGVFSIRTDDAKQIQVKAHRQSYIMHKGDIPAGAMIDHMCHNTQCTNPDHLRLATSKQNQENRAGCNKNSKSGIRGVSWNRAKGKWVVMIVSNRKGHFGGYFAELAKAEKAAAELRADLFTHSFA